MNKEITIEQRDEKKTVEQTNEEAQPELTLRRAQRQVRTNVKAGHKTF